MATEQLPKPDPNTYWVVPGQLLAGEYPGDRDPEEAGRRLQRFLQAGVRHFIDLTEADEPLEPYAELLTEEAGARTSYERFAIRDVSVPDEPKTGQRLLRRLIGELLQVGSPTSIVGMGSVAPDWPSRVGCRSAVRHRMKH